MMRYGATVAARGKLDDRHGFETPRIFAVLGRTKRRCAAQRVTAVTKGAFDDQPFSGNMRKHATKERRVRSVMQSKRCTAGLPKKKNADREA